MEVRLQAYGESEDIRKLIYPKAKQGEWCLSY